MSNSYYEKGANHYDHHKELHIDTVNGGDIGKLISAFFKDDAEDAMVVEEMKVDEESAEGSTTNKNAYPLSSLDSIFHKALNLVKVNKHSSCIRCWRKSIGLMTILILHSYNGMTMCTSGLGRLATSNQCCQTSSIHIV